jgi:hypothetical protein
VLVAADIVKTIAHELTFISLGLLIGLVLVRTSLSWTLVLEIEGRGNGNHRQCHREAMPKRASMFGSLLNEGERRPDHRPLPQCPHGGPRRPRTDSHHHPHLDLPESASAASA